MRFEDEGRNIRVIFEEGDTPLKRLADKIPRKIEVPKRYRRVVNNAKSDSNGERVYIELEMFPQDTSSGREPNETRLFTAVYQVGVKPVLRAIYELNEK
jgi:hypothetical protein